jgi:DNA polymerase-1
LKGKKLVLVDGSSLAFRSFFALFTSGLRTKTGTPTWAVLGFFNSLFDIIERYTPEMLAVCFDLKAPTFRHEEFADYKANRAQMPEDLSVQWPLLKQGIETIGLPVYELAGWEADDVIGSLARIAETYEVETLILTGDQDAFQLVDGDDQKIKILMPGKMGLQVFGRQEVFEKLSVWPEQIIDYKGLCGDTSDNIPGIRGIGPKTAVQLLAQFKTIEGIYENIDQVTAKALKQKLIEGQEMAYKSKRLATIQLDVPLEFDFEHCHLTPPDLEAAAQFFTDLEFKGLVKRLPKVFTNFKHAGAASTSSKAAQEKSLERPESNERIREGATATLVEARSAGGVTEIHSVQLSLLTAPVSEEPTAVPSPTARESLVEVALSGLAITDSFDFQIIDDDSKLTEFFARLAQQEVFGLTVQTTNEQALYSSIVGFGFVLDENLKRREAGYTNGFSKENQSSAGCARQYFYLPAERTGIFGGGQIALFSLDERLKSVLEDPRIGKIVHNAKSASNALFAQGVKLKGVCFDTMLASYIVFPDEKHGLKEQAQRILNYTSKDAGEGATAKKQPAFEKLPIQDAARYACDDARINLILADKYSDMMDSDQNFLMYEMELPLSHVLAKMEQAGVALDKPFLSAFSQELNTEITKLESRIFELAGHAFNINSTQQLQKVLFEEIGLKTKSKTKTGYSTDASVLEALKEEHEIIPLLLDYRQLTKLRSTYVDALPKMTWERDGRVHGEFNQTATATGRLSSSNPNLQNIPIRTEMGSRMRRAFIPENASHVLLSADYSQIELRLLAHMCEDPTLIDAFEKDQDVHARTAGEIFDRAIEEVTPEMRRVGKTLNFALVYQQGAYATAIDLRISQKEAAQFIEKYFARYGNVRKFLDDTIQNARQTGYVETIWKRRRYFKFLNERNDALRRAEERAACNAPIQGSAADLMKLAMIALDKELTLRNLNARLILQVHDELVLEVPHEELSETKKVIEEAMLMNQPFKALLKVDMGAGKSWMDTK